MKLFFTIILCCCIVTAIESCCSSQKAQTAASSASDTSKSQSKPIVEPPPAIKANSTTVAAIVESVATSSDGRYRLFVRITSAAPTEGMEGVGQAGQHLVLSPQYALDDRGGIDSTNERNKRLIEVQSLQPGALFRGKISLGSNGAWILVDVEKQ